MTSVEVITWQAAYTGTGCASQHKYDWFLCLKYATSGLLDQNASNVAAFFCCHQLTSCLCSDCPVGPGTLF